MKRRLLILLLLSALCADIYAKDVLLYSYESQRIEFVNQAFVNLLDTVIEYVENLKTNMSCNCLNDSIAYNVSFIRTSDWPLDKRIVINVSVDEMQSYLRKDCKYISYFNRKGKSYRINVDICCEEDIDWLNVVTDEFFKITDSITQNKYKRTYTEKEIQEMYEQGCMLEDDGGTELWFVYKDGSIAYWRGYFCDGSDIFP